MAREDSKLSLSDASELSCALSIAGLDPGGGAGLLADMRAFQQAGAFGCGVATALTVQSTSGLKATHAVASRIWVAQAREVLRHQEVRAIKVGALGSATNVRALGALLAMHKGLPVILDPVMLPSRGNARLLAEQAVKSLRRDVLPRATLVTANAPEAEVLTGLRVTRLSDAHAAARALLDQGCRMVLIKGGHVNGPEAVDVLAYDDELIELRSPRLKLPLLHGGGCVLSSLIAGRIASSDDTYAERGTSLVAEAVRWAKRAHHRALKAPVHVGGDMQVLCT
jgi:hydroxymethylpyrimidine kinase/phosphomethylpyrimidine kinase